MSTSNTEKPSTDDQIEPFPSDGEERDYEAAVAEMGLNPGSVFKTHNHVFEYRGKSYGEATVFRLSDPMRRDPEGISLLELWDDYQHGDLQHGEWRCEFVAENESSGENR
jgi:hypothetical protein